MLKIGHAILNEDLGLFARLLVEVDLAKELPKRTLLEKTEKSFFVEVVYESLPDFCTTCSCIGHSYLACWLNKPTKNGNVKQTTKLSIPAQAWVVKSSEV